MSKSDTACYIALIILDSFIRLPICEAHKIVQHQHNHDFVKILQVVCPLVFEGPCLSGDDHRNNNLEHQASNLVKQDVPRVHNRESEPKSPNKERKVVSDKAFVIYPHALPEDAPFLLKFFIIELVKIFVAKDGLKDG